MNIVACTWALWTINHPLSYLLFPIWTINLCLIWTITISFIYLLIKKQASLQVVAKSKKKFDAIMISTAIVITIAQTLFYFMKTYDIHTNYRIKDYNYNKIFGNNEEPCDEDAVSQIHQGLFFITSIFLSASYTLTLFVYYYRLLITFSQSVYAIGKKTKYLVYSFIFTNGFLVIVMLISYYIIKVFALAIASFMFAWLLYIIVSICLMVLFRKQLLKLIDSMNKPDMTAMASTSRSENINININISTNTSTNNSSNYNLSISPSVDTSKWIKKSANKRRKKKEKRSKGAHTRKLWILLRRFSILAYFSIIWTFLMIVYTLAFQIKGQNALDQYFEVICIQTDCIVSLLCMFAQFDFGNKIYKLFCKRFEKLDIYQRVLQLQQLQLQQFSRSNKSGSTTPQMSLSPDGNKSINTMDSMPHLSISPVTPSHDDGNRSHSDQE